MNTIQDLIDTLSGREKDLREAMTSAARQLSEHTLTTESTLRDLESKISRAQEEHKTESENAVAKAVAISNQFTEYQNLIVSVRQVVNHLVPSDATVIMVSKGDDELLKLDGRNAWHFPQNERGIYAGYYPSDSAEAIAALEALRKRGGQFLVFPQTALWWLDHYVEFRRHLDHRYRVLNESDQTARVYLLECPPRRQRALKVRASRQSAKPKKQSERKAQTRTRIKA